LSYATTKHRIWYFNSPPSKASQRTVITDFFIKFVWKIEQIKPNFSAFSYIF